MLQLQFEVFQSNDCTQFTFKDTTGIYNAISNPTGWGAPNEDITLVSTPITLDITLPDGITTYQVDLVTTNPLFPVDQPPDELLLDASYIGGNAGDLIPDGVYTFLYTVTALGGTYTQTLVTGFTCQVCCCVQSMLKSIRSGCDCCDNDLMQIMEAQLILAGLQCQLACGNIDQFNNTLNVLQRICKISNCDKCK